MPVLAASDTIATIFSPLMNEAASKPQLQFLLLFALLQGSACTDAAAVTPEEHAAVDLMSAFNEAQKVTMSSLTSY